MSDGLYERDVLVWSEHQANLLLRLGRGETVDGIDWENVAEEIESVGLMQLNDVQNGLIQVLVHLLKVSAMPDDEGRRTVFGRIVGFQIEAKRRFTTSMRERIDVDCLHADALKQLKAATPSIRFPIENQFSLDNLLTEDPEVLISRMPPAA